MVIATDLAISLTRVPIALVRSYPELSRSGWSLLSFIISNGITSPFIHLKADPKAIHFELLELAKSGYTKLKTEYAARLDMLPIPETSEAVLSHQKARKIIGTAFVKERDPYEPIDPMWIAAMLELETIVLDLEADNLPDEAA